MVREDYDSFSDYGVRKARSMQKYESEQFVLDRSEEISEEDADFEKKVERVWQASGMRESSKIDIVADMIGYYEAGDQDKIDDLQARLFAEDGRETFIPSE